MKKTNPVTKKGVSTRDNILHLAKKELIENGCDAFAMRDIATKLGITLGNLQYYFKTREDLLCEVFKLAAAEDIHTIQAREDSTPHDTFRFMIKTLVVRWRGQNGVLFSTLGTLALHNGTFRKVYRANYENFYKALSKPLVKLNPDLSEQEVMIRVRLITALIDGSSMQVGLRNIKDYLEQVQDQAMNIALQK